jgi:hypothetical protein
LAICFADIFDVTGYVDDSGVTLAARVSIALSKETSALTLLSSSADAAGAGGAAFAGLANS